MTRAGRSAEGSPTLGVEMYRDIGWRIVPVRHGLAQSVFQVAVVSDRSAARRGAAREAR